MIEYMGKMQRGSEQKHDEEENLCKVRSRA